MPPGQYPGQGGQTQDYKIVTEFLIDLYTSPLALPSMPCGTVARDWLFHCLMLRREFDPATDSEADIEEEGVANDSAESGNDDELENEEK